MKPYFSLDVVLKGLFSLLKRLFGIDIVELSSEEAKKLNITTWHKDVKLFKILTDKKITAYFYLDPYTRPASKKGGAWMIGVKDRTNNSVLIKGP